MWFDRGLAWCYGFNHAEAVVCFERALEHDPGCAMAVWGIAYAVGPNYNKLWPDFGDEERDRMPRPLPPGESPRRRAGRSRDAARAGALAASSRALSRSTARTTQAWNDAYAEAMRAVYRAHRDQLDVVTLFADAMMCRTPWALWDLETGAMAEGASTAEIIEVLEGAMRGPRGGLASRRPAPHARPRHGDVAPSGACAEVGRRCCAT